jgi:hypothetical protein
MSDCKEASLMFEASSTFAAGELSKLLVALGELSKLLVALGTC